MLQKFKIDPDPARWDSGARLKHSHVKLLCAQCGVLREVKYRKPLREVVLADCGHERKV
jgi:hypothetical protein